jgi:DNA invertase Pin-like site-specific DNA recombinase
MALLGYTRVSPSLQDPALQRNALLELGVNADRIFSDVVTGTRGAAQRPAWSKLSGYARDGDVVVVWRIDRLGRSLIDVLSTVAELRERGIEVRSISDGIDPSTPTGRLMLGLLATLAEYERELIRERSTPASRRPRLAGSSSGARHLTRTPLRQSSQSPAKQSAPWASLSRRPLRWSGGPGRRSTATGARARPVSGGLEHEHAGRPAARAFPRDRAVAVRSAAPGAFTQSFRQR